jgi:hypothetical protein
MAEAAAPGRGWAEKTFLALRALLAAMLAAPLESRVVLIEAQSAGPAALSRYDGLVDRARDWLARGRELSGTDLPAAYELTAVSGLAFYLQQCVLDPRRHQLDGLLEETASLLLEPVIGSEGLAQISVAAVAG